MFHVGWLSKFTSWVLIDLILCYPNFCPPTRATRSHFNRLPFFLCDACTWRARAHHLTQIQFLIPVLAFLLWERNGFAGQRAFKLKGWKMIIASTIRQIDMRNGLTFNHRRCSLKSALNRKNEGRQGRLDVFVDNTFLFASFCWNFGVKIRCFFVKAARSRTSKSVLGCPRKLGSMVSKWVITYL